MDTNGDYRVVAIVVMQRCYSQWLVVRQSRAESHRQVVEDAKGARLCLRGVLPESELRRPQEGSRKSE